MKHASTQEGAFEAAMEEGLVAKGYKQIAPESFDRETCIFPETVVAFIKNTQPKLWEQLQEALPDTERAVTAELVRTLDANGTLSVFREGFKVRGKLVRMAHWRPSSSLNPDTLALYGKNVLGVTRQLKYSHKHENSIDIVLSLNGLPFVAIEAKNQFTGQTVYHAIKQYQEGRSPEDSFFGPKEPSKAPSRCLVEFAVDPFEVFYTTKLNGTSTFFLPFNKGNAGGKGNPKPPEGKHATHYLWEDALAPDSALDILQRFLCIEKQEHKTPTKVLYRERMVFPRYHQLEVVRSLESASRAEGPGNRYLIQHSAGSGKSNSIAWLAHRLSSLHKGEDKVFDAVVVITDRRILDAQIRNTIRQFEQTKGVVEAADKDSSQLAEALAGGAQIIVTTLQKFPFVTQHLVEKLPGRKYAIIVDEAHSSQTGEAAAKMKEVLRGKSLEEAAQIEAASDEESEGERLVSQAMARGKAPNISFYAFTATPKAKTLGMFGRAPAGEKPRAFHVYSMRQAIEEGFILNVLENYTTWKTYYNLVKTLDQDVVVEKDEAAKAIAQYANLHPTAIAQKVHIIVEHFRTHVMQRLGGRAKAMVVTASRKHAVHYKLAMDAYIRQRGYSDVKTLVAFSGTVVNDGEHGDGKEYREVTMNPTGVTETNLPRRFEEEYHVLIVAEKYQTGFDQPLLVAMYVDKKLEGVHAVQTLSRLNRIYPGKTWTFVLDFRNEPEGIKKSFQPFFEWTTIDQEPNHGKLYELQKAIMDPAIIPVADVKAFGKLFFKPLAEQQPQDNAKLYALTDEAVKSYTQTAEAIQRAFRESLKAYIHLYGYLAQLVDFHDKDLERLYVFGRYLWKVLPKPPRADEVILNDEVALKYLRVEKKTEGAIVLDAGKGGMVRHPAAMGTKKPSLEFVELKEVVDAFNAKFDTEWTEADKLYIDSIGEYASQDKELKAAAKANTLENFRLKFDRQADQIVVDRQEQNESIASKFFEDKRFGEAVKAYLARTIYEALRAEP